MRKLAFFTDGSVLVSGDEDGQVRKWDLTEPTALRSLVGGTSEQIESVDISSSGTWFAAGTFDGMVRVWHRSDLSVPRFEIDTLQGNRMTSLRFSTSEHWIAAASFESPTWFLLDLRQEGNTPNRLHVRRSYAEVFDLAFEPEGSWIATAGVQGAVEIWRLAGSDESIPEDPLLLDGTGAPIRSIQVSEDGSRIVAGTGLSGFRGIELLTWERDSGRWSDVTVGRPHSDIVKDVALSPDGSWILTAGWDNRLALLKWPGSEEVLSHRFDDRAFDAEFHRSGRWAAVGAWDNTVALIDLETIPPEVHILRGHLGRVLAVEFVGERWLATGAEDESIRVWDLGDLGLEPIVMRGHEAGVWDYSLASSLDGRLVISGSRDGTVRLWQMNANELVDIACSSIGSYASEADTPAACGSGVLFD